MRYATIEPVRVRHILARTPIGQGSKSYAKFWLQPQVYLAGRWQGGEQLLIKRVTENEFKIGALRAMTLEEAARYVEGELMSHRVPFFGSEPWEHPFTYNI